MDRPRASAGALLWRRARRHLLLAFLLALILAALLAWLPAVFPWTHGQNNETERDAWQQPDRVMDALGVGAGTQVADVGCGRGYFVVRLARRVGSSGRVYGVDIDADTLRKVRRRVRDEGFSNVEIIEGRTDDTRLPAGALDAVLIVNAYHEMEKSDAMLASIRQALKPGGLLGIIDTPGPAGESREAHRRSHTIPESVVQDDAVRNGFRFLRREPGFERPENYRREWFFLVFQKPTE